MYNILEDQTVNQTKHAWQLGNIAIVFVSHVFCKEKIRFISHMEDNTKLHPEELNITFAELNQTVNWTRQLINKTVNKWAPHCTTYRTYTLEQQIAW